MSLLHPKEIEKIDKLANSKLDEIIESKISKEEIMGGNKRGIPLKYDPFFNLIRNDIKCRR